MRLKKYSNFIKDTILNIIATIIPLIGLQLLILPVMAKYMGAEEYGVLLTIVSLITMVSNSLGNSLNNIRLIQCSECQGTKQDTDYNFLLVLEELVNIAIIFLWMKLTDIRLNTIEIFCVVIYAVVSVLREYYVVYFRIILNYKKIVRSNICLFVGYLVGYIVFRMTGIGAMVYLTGIGISLIYVMIGNPLVKERITRTMAFRYTLYSTMILSISSLLESALNYADRLIIYPMIGGTAVSIYYTATLLGKVINSGITPVTSVVLSYISKRERTNLNEFKLLLGTSAVLGIIGYIVCIFISKPVLGILYPKWVEDSLKYIYITTLSAVCSMVISVVRPFVLKFCNIVWQLVINAVSFSTYLIISIVLFQKFGLYGFCVGVFISVFIKLVILLMVYYKRTISDSKAMEE